MQLYNKILLGLVLGIVAGFIANYFEIGWFQSLLVGIQPIGTAWIRLITMIVVPLVVVVLLWSVLVSGRRILTLQRDARGWLLLVPSARRPFLCCWGNR